MSWKLWRRLLWILCMLHLNELPWRHIFVALDGPTSSHNTFLGVIGKILPNVEDLEWSAKVEKSNWAQVYLSFQRMWLLILAVIR